MALISDYKVSIPESEYVCEFQKCRVDQNWEGVFLEEFGEQHYSLTLLPQFTRPQTWRKWQRAGQKCGQSQTTIRQHKTQEM